MADVSSVMAFGYDVQYSPVTVMDIFCAASVIPTDVGNRCLNAMEPTMLPVDVKVTTVVGPLSTSRSSVEDDYNCAAPSVCELGCCDRNETHQQQQHQGTHSRIALHLGKGILERRLY